MNGNSPGAARAFLLILKLGLRRRWNRWRMQLAAGFRRRPPAAQPTRAATPRKKVFGAAGLLVLNAWLVGGSFLIFGQFLVRLSTAIEELPAAATAGFPVRPETFRRLQEIERDRARPGQRWRLAGRDGRRVPEDAAAWSARQAAWILEIELRNGRGGTAAGKQELLERLEEDFAQRGAAAFRAVEGAGRHRLFFSSARWPPPAGEEWLLKCLAIVLVLAFLALTFLDLGTRNQDLGREEWHLEWLFTFPVPAVSLFLGEILGGTARAALWFVFFPFLVCVYWAAGGGIWSLPLGAAAALYLGLLLAALHLAVVTAARLRLTPGQRKNLQAACTLFGLLVYFAVAALILSPATPAFFTRLAGGLPGFLLANPAALPLLPCLGGAPALAAVAGMSAGALLAVLAALAACGRMVRGGLVGLPGAYASRRRAAAGGHPAPDGLPERTGGGLLPAGLLGKELRLFLRDRNAQVGILVMPLLVVALELVLNPALFGGALAEYRHAAALAFGLGSYIMVFGALGAVATEGGALWLLFTFPCDLCGQLRRKIGLWAGLGSFFALAVLAVFGALRPNFGGEELSLAAAALGGVIICAFLAGALGFLGAEPLAREAQQRLRPAMIYLYFSLASPYAFAFYAPGAWPRFVLFVLGGLMALAFWQKVREHAPFLLDPTESPPPRIALADGLVAVFLYFVLQGLLVLALAGLRAGVALALGSALAGLLVSLGSLYVFWRRKVPAIGEALGLARRPAAAPGGAFWSRAGAAGLAGGAAAAALGLAYLRLIDAFPPLRALRDETLRLAAGREDLGLAALAVLGLVVAPIVEEFVFRGMIYHGLRRMARPGLAALGSAALFAVVHSPLAVLPVFLLGLCAAAVREKSGQLAAAVLAHLLYNAAMLAAS